MPDYDVFEGYGMMVVWESEATGPVDHVYIKRSEYLDGTFEGIATVAFPQDYYVDRDGKLDSFYIIEERNASDVIVATHKPLWGDELMLRSAVAQELNWLLRIPVYRERLIFVDDQRTKAKITAWGSMNNYKPQPRIYISAVQDEGDREPYYVIPQRGTRNLATQIEFENDGITWSGTQTADYAEFEWYADYNGYIYFVDSNNDPISVKRADNVLIDYTFQAVSPRDINVAIYLAACEIVAQPGVNKGYIVNANQIGNIPRPWDAALVDGAAYRILRKLALSLNQRERMLAFRDWQVDGDDPAKRLLDMAKEYGDKFKDEKELLTKYEYPQTVLVIGQEYMLPGQRNRFFRMNFAATQ